MRVVERGTTGSQTSSFCGLHKTMAESTVFKWKPCWLIGTQSMFGWFQREAQAHLEGSTHFEDELQSEVPILRAGPNPKLSTWESPQTEQNG